jgi:hypothetical protein
MAFHHRDKEQTESLAHPVGIPAQCKQASSLNVRKFRLGHLQVPTAARGAI